MRAHHVPLPPDPVLYEIYVRSFFDSNGDGVGDILGIVQKLDYLAELGIDGIWLTPVFKSPQFDFGYDVSDYFDLHSEYGTLSDFKKLVHEAHARRISVVLDVILGHTSIEHPWFREHPDRYIWAKSVPNNWLSVFGGSAWTLDDVTEQFYYHRFYKEQPNLNWNSAEVRAAMHEILEFWIDIGVDGFRLDSLDGLVIDEELRDEPSCTVADLEGRENDTWAEFWSLKHVYTSNLPQVVNELSLLTKTYPRTSFFVEADLPAEQLVPYIATGASAFAFDLLRSPANGRVLAGIIDGAGATGPLSWALSNHDQPRVASRWGEDLAGVAATLLLSLPGCSFIYQGDEIGMTNSAANAVQFDRSGRDSVRRPMQWTVGGGFTTGTSWLPMTADNDRNVSAQKGDPGSLLETYRLLIGNRRLLRGTVEVLRADDHRLVFRRGNATVNLNLGDAPVDLYGSGEVLFSTDRSRPTGTLGGRSAAILGERLRNAAGRRYRGAVQAGVQAEVLGKQHARAGRDLACQHQPHALAVAGDVEGAPVTDHDSLIPLIEEAEGRGDAHDDVHHHQDRGLVEPAGEFIARKVGGGDFLAGKLLSPSLPPHVLDAGLAGRDPFQAHVLGAEHPARSALSEAVQAILDLDMPGLRRIEHVVLEYSAADSAAVYNVDDVPARRIAPYGFDGRGDGARFRVVCQGYRGVNLREVSAVARLQVPHEHRHIHSGQDLGPLDRAGIGHADRQPIGTCLRCRLFEGIEVPRSRSSLPDLACSHAAEDSLSDGVPARNQLVAADVDRNYVCFGGCVQGLQCGPRVEIAGLDRTERRPGKACDLRGNKRHAACLGKQPRGAVGRDIQALA